MSECIMQINRKNPFAAYIVFVLANSCMPVLLGQKPSVIVSFKKARTAPEAFAHMLDHELKGFQTSWELIMEDDKNIFVFLYNEDQLQCVIREKNCGKLLEQFGYSKNPELADCLAVLFDRFHSYQQKEQPFPDEIGLFLGYPVEDVIAYMKNKGENYLLCGFWKVYSRPERAAEIFALYKAMKEAALRIILNGGELLELNGNL